MKIKLSDIDDSYESHFLVDDDSFFRRVKDMTDGEEKTSAVSVDIKIKRKKDAYYIDGRLKGSLKLRCKRCIEYFDNDYDESFSLILTLSDDNDSDGTSERELKGEDLQRELLSSEEIDLLDLIAEQLALLCPMSYVCNDNCNGLCRKCGVNLNDGDCACDDSNESSPFAVLKNLK